ncbi:MAG: hypothetical protein RPU39_13790 [Candidatus Sedimenticola sp. (ex Thyasira tokunagai)]
MGFGKSKSSQSSRPLTADEVGAYFTKLDQFSGGGLMGFAKNGTPAVAYEGLTPDEIRSIGGAGATRKNALSRERADQQAGISSDPTMSLFQRQRAKQLGNESFTGQMDAINKETEAALTELLSREKLLEHESRLTEAERKKRDLIDLASIYYGGTGTVSNGKSSSFNMSL